MSSKQQVVANIQNSVSQGMISSTAADTILEQLDDIAVAGCAGVGSEEIDSEDATLVAVVIDASGSMAMHRDAVIKAYREQFLAPIQAAKNADSIFVTSWVFSGDGNDRQNYCRLIHGYKPVKECPPLDASNYDPHGGTPLHMAVSKAITGLVSYGQTLRDSGTNTKCIVVVLSDGEENTSGPKYTAASIRRISEDLLKQEIYILSYVFFGNENEAQKYADAIGFPNQHRLTGKLSDSEIRRIFGTISSSVISASQSQVSASGLSSNAFFANP